MIGILPAAGQATRLHGLPKFLLPIPDGLLIERHVKLMKPLSDMVYVPIKPDEYEYYDPYFDEMGCSSVDAFTRETMSQSVLSVYKWLDETRDSELEGTDSNVLFGLPDTFIEDDRCYAKLARMVNAGVDVAVGVFETRPKQHRKLGMCVIEHGYLLDVIDKPKETNLKYAWGVLAWRPSFWDYIEPSDPHVGYALPRAIAAGLDVRTMIMDGSYWDCGTPDEYFDLITHLHLEKA